MKIELIKEVTNDDFIALYKDAEWWHEDYESDISFIEQIVKGSFLFAAAFDESGKMIGMGRVLSDGCSDAYIQDVVVLQDHRKKGIGRAIIDFLVNELKERGIDWIGLIGEPGTESFYSHLGFKRLKDYIPMKLKN